MPSAPIVTWARIFQLLAAVTPRSRYLKKERRPAARGAVVGVAYASLPGGFTAAGCPIGVLTSSIMEASSEFVPPMLPDPRDCGRKTDRSPRGGWVRRAGTRRELDKMRDDVPVLILHVKPPRLPASISCLDSGGQNDVKTRAAWRVVRGPQAAVVRFNDGAADGQSHTGSMRLRRKECIEDLVRLLQGQPRAGIADAHRECVGTRDSNAHSKPVRLITQRSLVQIQPPEPWKTRG